MKFTFFLVAVVCALAAVRMLAQEANYDESKVGNFTLPDPLVLENGEEVEEARTWKEKRRPELIRLFEEHVYGRSPGKPNKPRHEILSEEKDALDGKATRRQVRIFFSDQPEPKLDLLIYLPNGRQGKVPVFMGLNFGGNHTVHSDRGIQLATGWVRNGRDDKATDDARGKAASRWPVEMILERGYGLVTGYYGDIDPDFHDGFKNGVHPLFYENGQRQPANAQSVHL